MNSTAGILVLLLLLLLQIRISWIPAHPFPHLFPKACKDLMTPMTSCSPKHARELTKACRPNVVYTTQRGSQFSVLFVLDLRSGALSIQCRKKPESPSWWFIAFSISVVETPRAFLKGDLQRDPKNMVLEVNMRMLCFATAKGSEASTHLGYYSRACTLFPDLIFRTRLEFFSLHVVWGSTEMRSSTWLSIQLGSRWSVRGF